ncbi:MAG: DUF1588 domain-containing protein [Verrucomicrobiota bacterium]|nr:DUF1588 domain-containing protein [Verrucomicrobiota bacterium]MEC7627027.1 DUF1588 domain-containing protein [Verrucomicrobiota bacterium]MEC8655810.1 DUF1588 domain-containing protein [Verrucomicrobiota bacterium]
MTILRNFLLSMALVSGAESLADDPFEERIRPFLQTYCIACHGEETQKGKIRLDHLRGDMEDRKEAELWARSLEAIEFGEMPSDKADKFPTKAQARLVQDWIAQSLDRAGRKVEDKAGKEGYGNLIPHDLLFSPAESKRVVNAAARLWRISPKALADIVRGARMVSNPFVLDKPHGNFRDFKGKYAFNSLMAEQVTELALAHSEKEAKNARKAIVMMKEKGITIDEANREAIKRHCHNVLRRTPTEKEMEIMMGLLKKVDSELGVPFGLQAVYASIILRPETLFRFEGMGASDDDTGLVALSRRELATSLAFALTDLAPDGNLLKAFQNQDLPPREILRTEIRRMLDDENRPTARNRLLQFFQEYFDYQKAEDVFKDQIKGHRHWAPALVYDLNALVMQALNEDKQVLKTLLTTPEYLVHVNSHRDHGNPLAYNLPPDWKPSPKPYEFPKDQRMGILTHPAWLVAHSGNFDNDPIMRGHWIRYKLLGGSVPDIPITVDAKLPEDENMTLRERMRVTQAEECYKCHSKMNPLGLPFEQFDHFGRFRFLELDKPVDVTSKIVNSGVPEIDGEIRSPFELIERLANSTHCEQVFVRYVFRFFMGRNETLGDAKSLQDAHKAYVDNDGSMNALVLSLLSSDSFMYRSKPISLTQIEP